ncbi:hypothetical protein N868_01040 [Cellulomonas carbonis T26]|uniref:Uncharacterized protein n=1 Tax=Cellulomonas carbonis T26 TaxID=947969 RepID=A0A0A0BWH6_9CELL|nr:hypothetical protein N868_01040 [Cellulomonas carbonis T26]
MRRRRLEEETVPCGARAAWTTGGPVERQVLAVAATDPVRLLQGRGPRATLEARAAVRPPDLRAPSGAAPASVTGRSDRSVPSTTRPLPRRRRSRTTWSPRTSTAPRALACAP